MKPFVCCVALLVSVLPCLPVLAAGDVAPAHGAPAHGAAPAAAPAAGAAPEAPLVEEEPGLTDQPYQLVRTLETIQDKIAEGSSDAHGFQRQFIGEVAEKMLRADDKVWLLPKNTRSAMVYTLSGGDPRVVQKLAKLASVQGVPPTLLKGVLAYAEGRNKDALAAFADVDHRAFDSRTAGHLALAKAMVSAPEDIAKSIGFLDDARLLCPGTLVEEAALRREVLLLANVQDYERFEMLAFGYLRRFPRSVYARNFSRSFAIAAASSKYGTDPVLMERLEKRLDAIDDDARKQLYMALAEEGVIRGRIELTRLAADKIGYLVKDGSRESVRLQLYKAAALVVTKDYDFALARLSTVDRTKLGRSDIRLLDNALALAIEVRQPSKIQGLITELPPLTSAAQVRHGEIAEKSEALDRARQALALATQLLSKEKR